MRGRHDTVLIFPLPLTLSKLGALWARRGEGTKRKIRITHETIQAYLQSGEDSFVEFKRDDVHPNSLARVLAQPALTEAEMFGEISTLPLTHTHTPTFSLAFCRPQCIEPRHLTLNMIGGVLMSQIRIHNGFLLAADMVKSGQAG